MNEHLPKDWAPLWAQYKVFSASNTKPTNPKGPLPLRAKLFCIITFADHRVALAPRHVMKATV